MANNSSLTNAKEAKQDEFYTSYEDIQKEMNAYLEYDANVFKDKTILCPCDDPEWSNFTKFFVENFETLGLKKLISTSYAASSKASKYNESLDKYHQITWFELNNPKYDEQITDYRGKIYILERDVHNSKTVNIDDLEWDYLESDGDFRSEEVRKLRDEADIIITNPPFSLFRDFVAWIIEANKQFCIIGNQHAITYKEVFPLLKDNKVWLGCTIHSGDREFRVPDDYPLLAAGTRIDKYGNKYIRVKGVRWYTNIEHGRRHNPFPLMTMEDNLKHSKHKKIIENGYPRYDNYDAIEVPFSDAIPSDYTGMMGVPITFMDKYCPEQFELIGFPTASSNENTLNLGVDYSKYIGYRQNGEKTGRTGSTFGACPVFERNNLHDIYYTNGERCVQAGSCERIFIKFAKSYIANHPELFSTENA